MGSVAILGARIRTLDADRPWASAVAIRDGVIVAVGDDDEVRSASGSGAELIDGAGMTVVPGLTDSHMHPFMGALEARGADLRVPPRWRRCASDWRPSGATAARASG